MADFVIDASITGSMIVPDEQHPAADEVLKRLLREEAIAPAIWWFEVRNLLIVKERRRLLTSAVTSRILQRLQALPIIVWEQADEGLILALARKHRLSVYDAAYLALAMHQRLPLATLDGALAKAARAESVALIEA